METRISQVLRLLVGQLTYSFLLVCLVLTGCTQEPEGNITRTNKSRSEASNTNSGVAGDNSSDGDNGVAGNNRVAGDSTPIGRPKRNKIKSISGSSDAQRSRGFQEK